MSVNASIGRPTFEILRVEDSYQYLKHMADESVDVTITDPPYSEHCHANLVSGSLVGTKSVPKYELGFQPVTSFHWVEDLLRVTRRWVIIFCTLEHFGLIEEQVGRKNYVRSGIWYKPNAMGQLTADRPSAAYEGIAILHPAGITKRWNGHGSFAIWRCNGTRGLKGRHPNQKPYELCQRIVALFSERGESVFDPFCGSASIGAAALSLGRTYSGFDSDSYWVKQARLRLSCHRDMMRDEDALRLCQMKESS